MVNDLLHIANFDHPGELSESFLYAQELSKVTQGSSTVAAYFNKLKRFWDELHSLNGIPVCSCGKWEYILCFYRVVSLKIDTISKLMQFLMRLNDDFEAVRNQILSMDPLPNLNKAYYIVQQVKKQKQVTQQTTDPTAFYANNRGNQSARRDSRSEGRNETKGQGSEKKVCTNCNQEGHLFEQCFESPYMDKETHFDFEYEHGMKGDKDLSTKKVLAVGEGCNNLYICKPSSTFTSAKSTSIPAFSSFANKKIVNNECLAYLRKLGIVHQKSMVYTPQQNAVVERKHRHLLDTARALKFHSGLLDKFWGDCVLTATYLINKMPMKIIDWKTPFEMLHDNEDVPNAIHDTSVGENVSNDVEGVSNTEENVVPNTPDKTVPNIPPPAPTQVPNTRKSLRTSSQPVWLKDFVLPKHRAGMVAANASNNKQLIYQLFQTQDFEQYPNDYVASLANVLAIPEPVSYSQAISNSEWVEAMNKELQALETNNTWTLNELPDGHKAISSKWVYKIKFYPDESVDKYKARLVIRGFSQKEGLDYKHTFSPVAKAVIVRVLIAIATTKGWPLHKLDVNNAFLHGFVDEEIYMKPPEGYTKAGVGQVCRLNKSLYGLKQAFMQWNHELSNFLVSLGFVQSKHDYSLFVRVQGTQFTAVLVYVDDILLTGNSAQVICDTKASLDKKFTIKDWGLAIYFLGIKLCNTAHGTYLHQMKYVLDLLKDAGLTAAKPTPFPLPQNLKLALNKGNPIADAKSYKRLVGRLLYLSMTRPDISYAVQHLSQFVSSSKEPHLQAAMHLLRYLKCSINKGLFYPVQTNLKVAGFSDADWPSCIMTKKSLTGYYLHINVQVPITLFCDNKVAQQIAGNPCYHERTKHLDIDSHFIRDKVQEGFLQTADIMTKALGGSQHSFLYDKLGFQDLPT
ncbi:retrovirus-related pol polyprotein from transposon TNT 1-94 [Tanacetum coccineum]